MSDFIKAKNTALSVLAENYISEPPIKVVELVKNYGFDVMETDLPNDIAGFVDPQKKVIYLNISDTPSRKAFTVAHELGHIKLHLKDLNDNPDLGILYRKPLGKKDEDPKEQEANCFAANLLVPEQMLKATIKKYGDLASVENLAILFGVSQEVIRYRLHDLNYNP